jgi:hypothetical protein
LRTRLLLGDERGVPTAAGSGFAADALQKSVEGSFDSFRDAQYASTATMGRLDRPEN